MKKVLVITVIVLMFSLSACFIFGPSLPAEMQGSWSRSTSYYSQTFTFTAAHMYYEDYASNTGGSASWDEAILEVNTDDCYFVTNYDCWSWHISGSTLYLKKEAYAETPDPALPDSWWSDTSVSKYTLTKD